MKKYLSVLTAIVMTSAIALTSCGKNESEGSSSATSQAAVKENSSEENVSSLSNTEKKDISKKYKEKANEINMYIQNDLLNYETIKGKKLNICPGDYVFSYNDEKNIGDIEDVNVSAKKNYEDTDKILRMMIQNCIECNDYMAYDKYNIRVLVSVNDSEENEYDFYVLYTEENSPVVRCTDKVINDCDRDINHYFEEQEINKIDDEEVVKILTDNDVKLTWTEEDEKEKQEKIDEHSNRNEVNYIAKVVSDFKSSQICIGLDSLKAGEYEFRITDKSPKYDLNQYDASLHKQVDTAKALETIAGSCLQSNECKGNYTFRFFVTDKNNIIFFASDDNIKGMVSAGILTMTDSNYKKPELNNEEIEKITSINDKKLSEIVKNAEK